jgi:hypothetical protein
MSHLKDANDIEILFHISFSFKGLNKKSVVKECTKNYLKMSKLIK